MSYPKPKTVELPPGLVLFESLLASEGRYIDGDKVRFVRGKPEKIGGWEQWSTSAMTGIARGGWTWNDLSATSWVAIGTHRRLYAFNQTGEANDITPVVGSGTIVNKLSTVNLSHTLTVEIASHNMSIGQIFALTSAASVGGLPIQGYYEVVTVISGSIVTVTHPSAATSTVTNGGGSVDYEIYLADGPVDPTFGFGYGAGRYGRSTYGTPRSGSSIVLECRTWSLDNMGKLLVAAPINGQIYTWDPTNTSVPRAQLLTGTDVPGAVRGIFVTPERYLVAYGASEDTSATIDTMRIRWPDQDDFTFWTPGAVGHQSNSRRLTEGKRLMAGTAFTNRLSLIWSDSALYVMQYTGSTFVYDTRVVGKECGLIGRHAFTVASDVAYWMGESGFFRFTGSAPERIPNSDDIADWVFRQARELFNLKAMCVYIPRYDEIWWFFVNEDDDEPAFYVGVKIGEWHWIKGELTRTTAARFKGETAKPMMVGTDGYLYLHEIGVDADGAAMEAFIKSAPIRLAESEFDFDIEGFIPDFQRHVGDLELTLNAIERSPEPAITDTETETVEPGVGLIDLHMAGRLVDFEIRSNVLGGDFRLGKPAFEFKPAGRRR